MNKQLLSVGLLVALLAALPAVAKLPPLSDEAKAKAAEAAAKTAHGNKVAEFQLCKSMDKVAADYQAKAKNEGKAAPPPEKTAPCADPGPFVYVPPAPAPATAAVPGATPAPAAAVAAAPAPAAAPKK
jgi:hypothetical protein